MKAKNYLIVGAGRSGIAAAQMLTKLNENFTVYDGNSNLNTEAVSQQTGEICATSTGIFYLSKNKLVVPEEN